MPGTDLARRKSGVQIPSPPPPQPAGQSVAGHTSAALSSFPGPPGATLGPRPACLCSRTTVPSGPAGRCRRARPGGHGAPHRPRVQVAVAIQGEAHRGVPSPRRNLLGIRTNRNPERDSRVPKVVAAQPIQSGSPGRRPPRPSAERGHPQRPTLRSREHEGVQVARPGQVRGQLLDHKARQPHRAPAGPGLGWPDVQHATDLHDDLGHRDRPAQQVDAVPAQPGQLPDAQTTVGAMAAQPSQATSTNEGQRVWEPATAAS
jgi:hypothetical protein